jgi:hypothetical protein
MARERLYGFWKFERYPLLFIRIFIF